MRAEYSSIFFSNCLGPFTFAHLDVKKVYAFYYSELKLSTQRSTLCVFVKWVETSHKMSVNLGLSKDLKNIKIYLVIFTFHEEKSYPDLCSEFSHTVSPHKPPKMCISWFIGDISSVCNCDNQCKMIGCVIL